MVKGNYIYKNRTCLDKEQRLFLSALFHTAHLKVLVRHSQQYIYTLIHHLIVCSCRLWINLVIEAGKNKGNEFYTFPTFALPVCLYYIANCVSQNI